MKSLKKPDGDNILSRPRKGAWIEMEDAITAKLLKTCRPRKGAWIEMRPL